MTMTEIAAQSAADQLDMIDQELLTEARHHLGGVSANEAINEALLLFVQHKRRQRLEALERLQKMAEEGRFDFSAIEEADR